MKKMSLNVFLLMALTTSLFFTEGFAQAKEPMSPSVARKKRISDKSEKDGNKKPNKGKSREAVKSPFREPVYPGSPYRRKVVEGSPSASISTGDTSSYSGTVK